MKSKNIKTLLAILIVVIVFGGCSSNHELPKTGNNDNEPYSSENVSFENQADNANLNENTDRTATTKESDRTISNTVSSGRKSSDPNEVIVVFEDAEGNVLKSEEIPKGDDATPPEVPNKDGYQFIGWNYNYEDVQTDITVTPIYEEIIEPTLMVEKVSADAGKEVEVRVLVYNNPGLLAMAVNIQYDDSVLTLTDVENGSLMEEYVFTPPKNMKSDCNAAWNVNDVPKDLENGEIMVLHFNVSNTAQSGEYSISVSCLNNAFDDLYNSFSFKSIDGSISVK